LPTSSSATHPSGGDQPRIQRVGLLARHARHAVHDRVDPLVDVAVPLQAARARRRPRQPVALGDARAAHRGFEAFAERFDVRIYMVYGMTEIPCVLRVVDPVTRRSLGTPVDPVYTARIVDENDLAIEQADVAGELVLRHELPWAISPGYLGDPDATGRVWRNGWFHTRDVFARDASGDFYVVDRVKDAIRRRGEKASAAEVETEILSHPDVTEAAAIAVPAEMDEEILAYAVARPGSALDEEGLHAYLLERLPYFAVPRCVVFADALPRNPALRVDKPQLRERGVPAGAWDREAAGIALQRDGF
jgi:carnitine-CoA ligase